MTSLVAVSALVATHAFAGPAGLAADSPVAIRAEALSITHNMTIAGSGTDLSLPQARVRLGPLRLFTTNGPTNVFDSADDASGADIASVELATTPVVADAPTVVAAAPGADIAAPELATALVVADAPTFVVAVPDGDIAFTELATEPVLAAAQTVLVAADIAPLVTAVPEPGTIVLLGLGLVGCVVVRRSRGGRR